MVRITNIVILTSLLLILLIPYTYGSTGICSLDKENYNPGEIATFQCSCTSPLEEEEDGYIVWRQDNGTILQSVATNSGACRTSLFGGSYLFPVGSDFLGNATFSLNADGTGDPINWDDPTDITFDNFNVSGAGITDCIISDIKIPSVINLGQENANVFKVTDGITGSPIVGATCNAIALNVDDSPILLEPYGTDYHYYKTVADGIGYLTNTFSQERFEIGITYEFDLYCTCPDNGSPMDLCYNQDTGERFNFKACSVTGLFTTNNDFRPVNKIRDNLLSYVLSFILFIVVLFVIGLVNSGDESKTIVMTKKGERQIFDVSKWRYWAMYSAYAFAVIEMVILSGFIYGVALNYPIENLLQINFWFMLIITVFLFMLTMTMSLVQIFTFREVNKWGEKW